MLLVSWNIKSIAGLDRARLERILDALRSVKPDLVLLQEVGFGGPAALVGEGLARMGLSNQFFGSNTDGRGQLPKEKKDYGNLIASTWPALGDKTEWAPGVPWPQLLVRASVQAPRMSVEAVCAHVPNGSRNGWRKIETFEALAKGLGGPSTIPRILTGDFNEPEEVRPDGEFRTFDDADSRWRGGVLSVLGTRALHGLRHAWFDRQGYKHVVTHVTGNKERFFDHIFVSNHFEVLDAGYYLDWRVSGLSDHAAGWAKLRLK